MILLRYNTFLYIQVILSTILTKILPLGGLARGDAVAETLSLGQN